VEPEALVQKRPYVIVSCFVVAMVLTPPDPFTQSLLAIPMWALFEMGILAGRISNTSSSENNSETNQNK
jgi:sec-independent protein translocase protein TatC